jgi:hypothetical protein
LLRVVIAGITTRPLHAFFWADVMGLFTLDTVVLPNKFIVRVYPVQHISEQASIPEIVPDKVSAMRLFVARSTKRDLWPDVAPILTHILNCTQQDRKCCLRATHPSEE